MKTPKKEIRPFQITVRVPATAGEGSGDAPGSFNCLIFTTDPAAEMMKEGVTACPKEMYTLKNMGMVVFSCRIQDVISVIDIKNFKMGDYEFQKFVSRELKSKLEIAK